ncbi:MAG: protein NrnU, partial [Proteobacteria bacterium]|nr:protein NrnU [Pseudomonadota bacterium]
FAHLIANNTLADIMLFGSFLVWAILVFRAARRRPAPPAAPGTAAGTAATVVLGVALWAFFAFWAHAAWLGIAPLGR